MIAADQRTEERSIKAVIKFVDKSVDKGEGTDAGEGLRNPAAGPLAEAHTTGLAHPQWYHGGQAAWPRTHLVNRTDKGLYMDWDIPRYWGSDGELHNADEDGPPSLDDFELGDSFLVHVVDEDGIDRYAWYHGGIDVGQYDDIEDALYDVIEQLYSNGSL